jgi:holo-ACP synthase CitX
MRYEELRSSLLAERDGRQALLSESLVGAASAIVTVSLNIPGPVKSPPGAQALFADAVRRLREALPAAVELHSSTGPLGPFSLWSVPADPSSVKEICVAIESGPRCYRLLDLDVYSPAGVVVDRAALGLPRRACLVCDRPAHECARRARHSMETLLREVHALLDDPGL